VQAASVTDRVINILVLEADPVMQSGLVTCLNRFPDLRATVAVETGAAALEILTQQAISIDVMLLGLPFTGQSPERSYLTFCQQVTAISPQLAILLLTTDRERDLIRAFQLGIAGCWAKGSSILDLVNGIRQVATGKSSWTPEVLQQLTLPSQGQQSTWRDRLRSSSLAQIESTLAELDAKLRQESIPKLDRSILAGRKRELNTARWLVKRLLPPAPTPILPPSSPPSSPPPSNSSQIIRSAPNQIAPTDRPGSIFDRIAAKLQSNLENLTPTPLEIDILRSDKKRELFYIILRHFEGLLDELRFSQLKIEQLPSKQIDILEDLWASVTTDFFGRYHTLSIEFTQVEIVPTILQDAAIVNAEILAKIPQPIELLNYLLFQEPLTVDNLLCRVGTPAAEERACALLENLTIGIANAVMQPLLNNFADLESMKTNFYDRRLLSSREIERFRNDLSWRYRLDRYVGEPQAIFESKYRLFILTDYGIKRIAIYAPRPEELSRLNGIPLAVTLALETRDALVPRVRSLTTFVGSGIVYLLTEIIGRGIGLIGRGVIKGVGNIWQENNRSRRE
jgi:DNA-binding NarL/FixJ family response regulator